ncbi:MAG: LarC family nickel insertion protein [Chloroflexota bacterium]
MRVIYFDCVGGASGDMLLSALLDAGASLAAVEAAVTGLRLPGCSLQVEQVMQGALRARRVTVVTPREQTERHPAELVEIIERAGLPEPVKVRARAMVLRLAEVEAGIHNSSPDHVHLHELGGDDTLIDLCGVLTALDDLQIERVCCSPLPLARGFTRSMHGIIPLPAPATLELLKDSLVRCEERVEAELVTPTGAVLLASLVQRWGSFPTMRLQAVGVGAGRRRLPFPNILRAWIGDAQPDQAEPGPANPA